ncbi:MAG: nuclear transport factor 2 family protein [bacterium]|nr:nuclear transport factor 2 family protein [bacterium]
MGGNMSIEDAVVVVERCFAALLKQDIDLLCENYTEDYVLELPYFKPGESNVVEGRENVRAYVGSFLPVQQMNLQLTGTHWIEEEQLLIAEYFCDGRFLDTGEPYANRYVGYWYMQDGRVRRLREYYNPQAPRASAIG